MNIYGCPYNFTIPSPYIIQPTQKQNKNLIFQAFNKNPLFYQLPSSMSFWKIVMKHFTFLTYPQYVIVYILNNYNIYT